MKRLESNQTKQSWFCCPIHFTGLNCRRQDFRKVPFIYLLRIQLFRERLPEKVHATISKGIVGDFEFAVLRINLKERHERPRTYVCGC